MPQLDLTPVDLYSALWPYHVDYDNIPIIQLINRELLINNALEMVEDILRSAIGTQGTLANRLAQSINDDGSLKAAAIDEAQHNIGYHTDGVGPDTISYVRMTAAERDKLDLIADEATAMILTVPGPSTISTTSVTPISLVNQTVNFQNSDTVSWRLTTGNNLYADFAFPTSAAHQHFYDRKPADLVAGSPDYQNYRTTSVATPFIDGSLRITINGMRLSATASVYVPGYLPTLPWTLMTYTYDATAGTFMLSTPITANDVIRIDFDAGF